ncbi:MAG: hypothetical protein AAF604_07745 [Acidobacteriota bacterium]
MSVLVKVLIGGLAALNSPEAGDVTVFFPQTPLKEPSVSDHQPILAWEKPEDRDCDSWSIADRKGKQSVLTSSVGNVVCYLDVSNHEILFAGQDKGKALDTKFLAPIDAQMKAGTLLADEGLDGRAHLVFQEAIACGPIERRTTNGKDEMASWSMRSADGSSRKIGAMASAVHLTVKLACEDEKYHLEARRLGLASKTTVTFPCSIQDLFLASVLTVPMASGSTIYDYHFYAHNQISKDQGKIIPWKIPTITTWTDVKVPTCESPFYFDCAALGLVRSRNDDLWSLGYKSVSELCRAGPPICPKGVF